MTLGADLGTPVDVDLLTGLPRYGDEDLRGFEAGEKMLPLLNEARNDVAEILASLLDPRTGAVLRAWINQLTKRMEELMKADPFCVAIMAGFAELGYRLNFAETMVESEIRRVAGINFPLPPKPE